MKQFTLIYNIRPSGNTGVADITVSAGEQSLSMVAGPWMDDLGTLAREIVLLLRAPEVREVFCTWADEPGQWQWVISRAGADTVRVEILAPGPYQFRQPVRKREVVFSAACSARRLATQVKGQLHRLLNEYGEQGYRQIWGRDFPLAAFEGLSELIRGQEQAAI